VAKRRASRHRIPTAVLERAIEPDVVDDRYQAQVDANMARVERRYRHAQKALQVAVDKAARAEQRLASETHMRQLQSEVDRRRRELAAIEALMMPTDYASRDHRGRGAVKHQAG
jgi:hypothetical protein